MEAIGVTRLLEEAFKRASRLPEEEQDRLAALLLADVDGEARWDALFAGSQDTLRRLAEEARHDYAAGRTEPLDPDTL